MRPAIQYIRHENQAIETVALRLGYGSLAAFSRAFKRIVGHAPGALKEASQPRKRSDLPATAKERVKAHPNYLVM